MRLYYAPGACSLAPHIVLRESGLPFQLEPVDLTRHQLADGSDFRTINLRGQVPVLEMADGERLTEGAVISQYISEQVGREDLLPACGTPGRYRVLEWQSFISSELHKGFTPLFSGELPADVKDTFRQWLRRRYTWVNERLQGRKFLTGNEFTVADAYLYTVTNWAHAVALDLASLTALQEFQRNVASRPAVRLALAAEGIAA
ncbi:MAG: glutathione transferase GstA [Gammaproteobacteria bacterium]|nr:glutathione transferase GstA [Gammaproteobacteria bacterium]